MKSQEAEQLIATSLFEEMTTDLEQILSDVGSLKDKVKYDAGPFNKSLSEDFAQIVDVLQGVVDESYFNYYEVKGFIAFSKDMLDDECWFDSVLTHNVKLVNNAKKLLSFIG